jgi:spermidine synthase
LELIKEVMSKVRAIFPTVHYAYTTIPTYPSGQIGFIIATVDTTIDVKKQSRSTEESLSSSSSSSSLKYYSKQVHHASFILPSFADKELNP